MFAVEYQGVVLKQSAISGTDFTASRIALGTASVHHLADRKDRETLILTARDAGISHFDTSPYYGFGIAERVLGVLSGSTETTTIATKVGLYPPGGPDQGGTVVMGRKLLGRLMPSLSKPRVDLSVAAARESLHGSLRRLGRDRVDVLFLHEPDHALFASDEWRRWLETERDRIGAVGIAGEADTLLPFVQAHESVARVIQTRDSLGRTEAAPIRLAGRSPQFTYGHLAHRAPADPLSPGAVLRQTMALHPETVLLVSTRRASRIKELAAACE